MVFNGHTQNGFHDGSKTDDYSFDERGNLVLDHNKSIKTIKYNHFNLPDNVDFGDGKIVSWVYDARGNKLSKLVQEQGITEFKENYSGIIRYKSSQLTTQINVFPNEINYLHKNASNRYVANYFIKDNRLSNRVIIDEFSNIIDELHYYPFGSDINMSNTQSISNDNVYKFNSQEQEQLEFGKNKSTNWYSYEARNFDPFLGKWLQVDPLTEKFPAWSAYNYSYNNPINMIDLDGRSPDPIVRLIGLSENTSLEVLESGTWRIYNLQENGAIKHLANFKGLEWQYQVDPMLAWAIGNTKSLSVGLPGNKSFYGYGNEFYDVTGYRFTGGVVDLEWLQQQPTLSSYIDRAEGINEGINAIGGAANKQFGNAFLAAGALQVYKQLGNLSGPELVRNAIRTGTGQSINKGWISKDIYSFLGKKNPKLREAFEEALQKGSSTHGKSSGIKYLSSNQKHNGIHYDYELKLKINSKYGNHRLYGNIVEWVNPKGVKEQIIRFDYYAKSH